MADYAKLIDKQVTNAFKKTVSLQEEVIFNLKKGESFDFGTGQPSFDSETPVRVKVLVIKTSSKNEVVKKQLLMERIADLDVYDSVTMSSGEWKIGEILQDTGHNQIVEVSRG